MFFLWKEQAGGISDRVLETMQDIVSRMNKTERELSSISKGLISDRPGTTEPASQGTSYSRTFENGFPHQIRGKTTKSLVSLAIVELQHGGCKILLSRNGNLLVQVPSYGFMENVGALYPRTFPGTDHFRLYSGRWKERPLVRQSFHISVA